MLRPTPLFSAALAMVLVLGSAGTARAQSEAAQPWKNTITLYGWFTGLSGSIGVAGESATVEVPFSDIADYLKLAGALNYTGRGQTWVVGVDFVYAKLGDGITMPVSDDTLAQVRVKQVFTEGNVGYRVTPWMDALIGVRVPILQAEITPDITAPGVTQKSNTLSWAAPIIGARIVLPATKHLTVIARGDIGGFGVGEGTNNTWQAAGYLNYGFGKGWSGTLGYRAINADHDQGTAGEVGYFKYDVTNYGGVLGVAFTF